jgi:S1-C subfamily serine protease
LIFRTHLPVDAPHTFGQMSELVDPSTSGVPRLGVMALEVHGGMAAGQPVTRRVETGIVVAARIPAPATIDISLAAGDVIYAVNGRVVASLSDLNLALDGVQPRAALVLQVERDGELTFLSGQVE